MEQAVFEALSAEFRRSIEETIAEAAAVEDFARTYPPFVASTINISPGRDLGEMYVVTVQGRRAPDTSRSGPLADKINGLVYRAQHRRRFPHPPR